MSEEALKIYSGGSVFTQRNKNEAEIRLDPRYNTEQASKSGHNLWKRKRLFDPKTKVGTTYQKSLVYDARFINDKLLHVINRDATNNLLYIWEASNNGVDWRTIQPETTITPAEKDDYQTNSEAWAFYRVQAKSSAGTVELEVVMSGQK